MKNNKRIYKYNDNLVLFFLIKEIIIKKVIPKLFFDKFILLRFFFVLMNFKYFRVDVFFYSKKKKSKRKGK